MPNFLLVVGATLPIAAVVWFRTKSHYFRQHLKAFLLPFLHDNALTSPNSENVLADIMSRHFPSAPHPLKGQVAIVTGCTLGGIGAHTALLLAGRVGMTVVCAGRSQEKMDAAVAAIVKVHPSARAVGMVCDVSDFQSVRRFVAAFEQKFPASAGHSLAVLVNNAGIMLTPYTVSPDG